MPARVEDAAPHSSENPLFYQSRLELPVVSRAEGVWLFDKEGKGYLDGSSGAVVAGLGHAHPRILEAMWKQAAQVSFAYRTQFENEPAVELGRALVERLTGGLERVFYVSGGSKAVEAAIKLARQFHVANGESERWRVISHFPSYHGSTLGALSATGYRPLTDPFAPMLRPLYVPTPTPYRPPFEGDDWAVRCARELERILLEVGPETVSAFILEPVGGASTGAVVPPPEWFTTISEICKRYGVLTIYDEVMTGVGRTGAFCAYQHWEPHVDILTLSKGLGAGYTPLGAVVCQREIAETVLAGGGFMHGHTYAGNPLSCAVGLEVLCVVEEEGLVDRARVCGERLIAGLGEIQRESQTIGDVRGKGLLLGVEFVRERSSKHPFPPETELHRRITEAAFAEGLIVYPRRTLGGYEGDHVLVAPPLIISEREIEELLHRFAVAVARVEREL